MCAARRCSDSSVELRGTSGVFGVEMARAEERAAKPAFAAAQCLFPNQALVCYEIALHFQCVTSFAMTSQVRFGFVYMAFFQ
jgi:hypothetical protein